MDKKPQPAGPHLNPGVTREIRSQNDDEAKPEAVEPGAEEPDLRTQYERDQSSDAAGEQPQEVMRQAKRDLDAGLVDTDLRSTPGADAERQRELLDREKQRSEQNSGGG